MEWDDSKAEDKEYLKKWYQSRIDYWKINPIGGKIVKHYKILKNYKKGLKNG